MAVRICSLKVEIPQLIADDGKYHLVRFPYIGESYDDHNMHQPLQPGGSQVTDWRRDDRSGLIWPAANGWGVVSTMVQWEPGGYSELRDRVVRNPLGTSPDSTATDHRPPSPGMQSCTKTWQMFVHPSTPLGLLVAHNDDMPRRVVLAEFKLAIHT